MKNNSRKIEMGGPSRTYEMLKRILVVDDERLLRWFLEKALKKWGYEVTSVGSVGEALSRIENYDFDIVFTDLQMPEGNGTYLIKALRKKTDGLKIVVCSAFIPSEMAEDFKQQGILILGKPFKLAELEAILDALSASIDIKA